MSSATIFLIYALALLAVVVMTFGLGITVKWMTRMWRENLPATVAAIEPVRRRNRWLIGYEIILAVVFGLFYLVTADSRFSLVTVVCFVALGALVGLQLLIKLIYRLEPVK